MDVLHWSTFGSHTARTRVAEITSPAVGLLFDDQLTQYTEIVKKEKVGSTKEKLPLKWYTPEESIGTEVLLVPKHRPEG
jgi:hypothetical protein